MVQRSLWFLALATGVMSCTGDPTDSLRNGTDHLLANPTSLFVREDSSKFVLVSAVDEQGNSTAGKFTLSAVGAGITVVEDVTFGREFNDKGELVRPANPTSIRYIVTANANTADVSFKVSQRGKDLTIPVRVLPLVTSVATLSNATPGVGDTVTLTVPAPYRFTPASVASVGTTAMFKAALSADSSTLRVVGGPGLTGPVSVSGVILSFAPAAATITVTTPNTITTPALPNVTLNTNAAVAGDTIVVTAPPRFRFIPGAGGSSATVGTAGLALVGVSTDSSQLRFLIGPSANARVLVTNLRLGGALTLGPFTDSSAAALTTPVIPNFAGTFSTATPAVNDTVVLTVPSNFRLLPTSTVTNAGASALVISRSADSTQIRFIPARGTTAGPVTVTGIVLSFLRTVSLTLPTATNLTPPAALAGTGAIATAPTIPLPAVGQTVIINDGLAFTGTTAVSGGVGNKFYKITVPAATSVTVNMRWTNTADVDILYGLADGSDFLGCFTGATSANPEQATCTLPTGDTILFANLFAGTAPGLLRITLTRNN